MTLSFVTMGLMLAVLAIIVVVAVLDDYDFRSENGKRTKAEILWFSMGIMSHTIFTFLLFILQ